MVETVVVQMVGVVGAENRAPGTSPITSDGQTSEALES